MRYAVSQLISKVGSLLQDPSSFANIQLPPELSQINVEVTGSNEAQRNDTEK